MDKNGVGKPCPVCRRLVRKGSTLGGSVYTCPTCRRL